MVSRSGRTFVLLLPLLLLLMACGGGGSSDPGGVNAQDVLSRSAAKFQTVKTFHFKLDHQNSGFIPIVLGLHLITAEGDVMVPNRISAEVQAKAGPTTVRVNVIGIDDKTWITNPFTREYQRAPGDTSVGNIVDPVGLITSLAQSVQQPKVEGMETVDGVTTYHITGTLQSDVLTKSLTFADAGRTLDVEAWIGKDDSLPRRARIKGALVQDEKSDVARTIDLSKFDAPVNIQPPP